MTLLKLISELQRIVREHPEKADLPVCIYAMSYTEAPENISMIDSTISDRIDINGTEDLKEE